MSIFPKLTPDTVKTALDAVAATGTIAAAVFSAVSAWMARNSVKAAQISIDEGRAARKQELLPRLVLEKDFLDFSFHWPHAESLNGEPVFLARKDWKDNDPSPPTFSLTNYGESPALEVEIIFDFADPNGDLEVPAAFAPLGLTVMDMPAMAGQPHIALLQYSLPNGRGAGLPLYRRMTVDFPNCAPGQKRIVEFPAQLLNRLLLRGLQYWDRRGTDHPLKDIILTLYVKAHAIDGQEYQTQFRFRIFPFFQGQTNPLIVVGHCVELPMFERSDDLRVA